MSRLRKQYPNLFKSDEVEESEEKSVKITDDDITQVQSQPESTVIQDDETEEVSKVDKKVTDMYGNFIQAGDYINYPGRSGSDTYMRTAKVIGLAERNPDGDNPVKILKLAVAMAPRWPERKNNPNWETKVVKTTMSQYYRASVIPKSYIQNDKRYQCLLEV